MDSTTPLIILGVMIGIAYIVMFCTFLTRYKKCPPDKVMVIYGRTPNGKGKKILKDGAAFIWPVIQDHKFLSMEPLNVEYSVDNAKSKDKQRVSLKVQAIYGIAKEDKHLETATERLMGLEQNKIEKLVGDIVEGRVKSVISSLNSEEIEEGGEGYCGRLESEINEKLKELGLKLINLNVISA